MIFSVYLLLILFVSFFSGKTAKNFNSHSGTWRIAADLQFRQRVLLPVMEKRFGVWWINWSQPAKSSKPTDCSTTDRLLQPDSGHLQSSHSGAATVLHSDADLSTCRISSRWDLWISSGILLAFVANEMVNFYSNFEL